MRLLFLTLSFVLITSAAYAINPAFFAAVSGQGGGAVANPYDSATIILSANEYTSGQTWSNTGSAGTSCDSYIGKDGTADATDPTFSTDEFQLDGGDYFQFINTTCTTTNNAHMTGGASSGPKWLAFAFQLGAINANIAFYGNSSGGAVEGIRTLMNATENLRFLQGDGTVAYNQVIVPDGTWAATTDYLFILTLDSTSTGSEKYWINTTTGSSWAAAYTPGTTTTTAPNPLQLGATINTFVMPSGSKVYGFFGGDELLDDTGAKSVCESIETELNKDFDGNSTVGSCTN